jgi:hypothetical protein
VNGSVNVNVKDVKGGEQRKKFAGEKEKEIILWKIV